MKLKTVTKFAAITQLLALLFQIAVDISSLVELIRGQMKWEYSWKYFLGMPFFLLTGVALTLFMFTLAAKQKPE